MANIEQHIAEAEDLMAEVPEDEIVLRASKQVVELRMVLDDVEWRLGGGEHALRIIAAAND